MFQVRLFPIILNLLLSLSFFVFTGFAQRQYSVSGKVVKKDYQGIKDVPITVKCNGEDHKTVSQVSGYYKIPFQSCSIVTISFGDRRYYAEQPISNLSGTSNHTITKVLIPNNGTALLTEEEGQNVVLAYLIFKSNPEQYKTEILEYSGSVTGDRLPEKYRSIIQEFETVANNIRKQEPIFSPNNLPEKNFNGNQAYNGSNPMIGGAAMYKSKDIIANIVNSKDHTTLVAAIKATGLVETLRSKGPFTVFAPTNAAFDYLPAGTVDTLLKPENKAMLAGILTYHIIAGNIDSKAIVRAIKKGNGVATFETVSGGILIAKMDGNTLVLIDEKGGMSKITIADVKQSNGVIHVIDSILLPN